MSGVDYDKLISSYLTWLKSKISVKEINGVAEITTPFLDRHNDHLQFYIKKQEDSLLLSDDGYVLSDLEMSGWEANTPRRREMLTITLNGYGVECVDGELFVKATEKDFPQKKHSFIQAMMAVNDMALTSRHNTLSLFFEDVESFLLTHDVRFVSNFQFTGRSGFGHKFDFVIPRSKEKPERIIRAVNSISRDISSSLMFSWMDTRETRQKDSLFYVIINDLDKPPNNEVVDALTKYSIKPILWTQRELAVDELSA